MKPFIHIWLAAFVFSGIPAGFACIYGHYSERQSLRAEAVKAGVAKYVATETGEVRFEWIRKDGGE